MILRQPVLRVDTVTTAISAAPVTVAPFVMRQRGDVTVVWAGQGTSVIVRVTPTDTDRTARTRVTARTAPRVIR